MFYSLPNITSTATVELAAPWDFKPGADVPLDKAELIKWGSRLTTDHAFVSAYEGLSPNVRITSTDNPAFKMHALIVDYDRKLPENAVQYIMDNPASEFKPAYLVDTARGNARLVWLFERPMLIADQTHIKSFLKVMNKQLHLIKWLGGYDTPAYSDPSRYYEVGKKWHKLGDHIIPAAHLELWVIKAAAELQFDRDKQLQYKIPMEALAAEAEERYPGRWKGPFTLGGRGVRFWDATADNETAAVLREDGVLCFTGDKAFVSWREIFGTTFVEQYEANYVAGIIEDAAYDGRSFWLQDNGRWAEWGREDFSQELRVRGYEGRKKSGKAASELDLIENAIKKTKRVSRALPFLFFPRGIITRDGEKYLNTSHVTPIAPSPPVTDEKLTWTDGRQHFPFVYELMRTMFVNGEDDDSGEGAKQFMGLLSWLKYFYCQSREGTPRPGHTIVLAGPTNKGKTLFSRGIVGKLMGGHVDAASHLVDGSEWTEHLINAPVMRIDDSLALGERKALINFTNRIKKYTANAEIMYNQKYKQNGAVPWFGRIIVTCNLDAESLRILPDMDISTRDKISLFRTSDHRIDFPSWQEIDKILARELPIFALFLRDWEIPAEWRAPEARFGVRPYHHPELLEESKQQGLGTVLELLASFMDSREQGPNGTDPWIGTATVLYANLSTHNAEVAKEIKAHGLATLLGKLMKNGYKLEKYKDKETRLNTWKIHPGFQKGEPTK